MTDQELKKLRRTDLLELLLAQEKEIEALRLRVKQLQICLDERELTMVNAGSIADAAMQLNGVFQAAQAAADQYLASIRKMNDEKEAYFAVLEEESRIRAEQTLRETEERCRRLEEESQARADLLLFDAEQRRTAMLEETKEDLKSYWVGISTQMESLYKKQIQEEEQMSGAAEVNGSNEYQ